VEFVMVELTPVMFSKEKVFVYKLVTVAYVPYRLVEEEVVAKELEANKFKDCKDVEAYTFRAEISAPTKLATPVLSVEHSKS
jgi:hypothetical protein